MKLPDVTSLSRPRISTPGGPLPSYSPAGFSAGTEAIAKGLGDMAKAVNIFVEDQQKLEEFETQRKFYETMSAVDQQYQQSEQDADPTGKDFSRNATAAANEHFKGFLETVPQRLRPKYEAVIERQRFSVGHRAFDFELKRRESHYIGEVGKHADALAPGVQADPDSYDAALADVNGYLDSSGLSPVNKQKLRETIEDKFAESRIKGLIDQGRVQEAEQFKSQLDARERERTLQRQPRIGPVSAVDRDLMIRTVLGEAGGESEQGQAAVAHVILNRASAGRYGGNSVSGVVNAPGQFEPWQTKRAQLMTIDPQSPEYQKAAAVVDRVLAGGPDPTGGATHFYAPDEMARRGQGAPAWARGGGLRIGSHSFHAPEGRVARGGDERRFAAPGLTINYVADENRTYGKSATANAKPFSAIVAHHTGVDTLDGSMANLRGDPNRGGASFGYHFYIDKDGTIYQGVPLNARTNHVKSPHHAQRSSREDIANENAVGIAFVGSGSETQAQKESAVRLASALMRRYGINRENVVGHGEIQGDRHANEGMALVSTIRSGAGARYAQAGSGTATDASSQAAPKLDPSGAPDDLLAGDAPVGRWHAYFEKARAAADKETARLAREASAEIGDYSAFLRAGNERDGAREAGLKEKYGRVVGDAIIERLNKDAAFGQKVRSVETASPEELSGIISDYQQRLKSVDGFAETSKEFADILKVVERRNKALADDPATFVLRSEDVKQSYQAFQTAVQGAPEMAPGLARDYASATLAEQERLGVPADMRRILPASMVDHIGKQFIVREGGQNAAMLMRSLESQWGNHWPKVYGELAKSLPGGALVVGAMNRPEQARAAEQLAEAAAVGKKQLEQMHKDESLKDLKAGVLSQLNEFRSTLVNNPGAEVTFNTFQEATYLLALSYLGQGESVDRAAKRAFDDVLGKKYEFAGTYRIPLEYNGAVIRSGAYGALYEILPKTDIDIPPSLSGLKPADVKAAYVSALQANGFWVTAPDESGLVLYEGTQRRAVTVGGKPFLVPWSQLQRAGGAGYDASIEAPAGFDPIMDAPPEPVRRPPQPEPLGSGITLPGGAP